MPATQIPAFLPERLIPEGLPDLGMQKDNFRRAIPIVLHQHTTDCSLDETAGALGYTRSAAQAALIRLGRFIEAQPRTADFLSAFPTIADALITEAVNYEQRRAMFGPNWRISDNEWSALLGDLRARKIWRTDSDSPRRRDQVSLWVWSIATSGDPRHSPMFTEHTGQGTTTNGVAPELAAWSKTAHTEVIAAIDSCARRTVANGRLR